jgi:modification target Cys-rich repeat protein
MKKKTPQKMTLRRETLRQLDRAALEAAEGGKLTDFVTCYITCLRTCQGCTV